MSAIADDQIRTLDACVRLLERQLRELEDRIRQAEDELRELKAEAARVRPIHIEAVNYKVQELVVSELSGTLHVGLTALTDSKSLEKIVGGEAVAMENLPNEAGGDADGG
jgi:sugar-specific transcriptional regulator TrmB